MYRILAKSTIKITNQVMHNNPQQDLNQLCMLWHLYQLNNFKSQAKFNTPKSYFYLSCKMKTIEMGSKRNSEMCFSLVVLLSWPV